MLTRTENLTDRLLDRLAWPIIKIFWEPFSKKRSHWWHWKKYNKNIDYSKSIDIQGQPNKHSKGFLAMSWQQNFDWKNVVVLEPWPFQDIDLYQIGFSIYRPSIAPHREICSILMPRDQEIGLLDRKICSILIPGDQVVGLLVGSEDVEFFAIEYPSGKQIGLKKVSETTKKKLGDIILI